MAQDSKKELSPKVKKWEGMVEEWERSQMSAEAFAEQKGIHASTLRGWRRKLKMKDSQKMHPKAFVEVSLPTRENTISIDFHGRNFSLRVPVGTEVGWLRRVVEALS